MLKETLSIKRQKAVVLVVDLESELGVEGYAMAWLKLTNNAREYYNTIWKIENDNTDKVYVYVNPKQKDNVIDFCNGIYVDYIELGNGNFKTVEVGKVVREYEEEVGFAFYDYSSTYSYDDEKWHDDIDNVINTWMRVTD